MSSKGCAIPKLRWLTWPKSRKARLLMFRFGFTPLRGRGPRPVLQWMHGGGWVIGSAERADPTARELCSRSGCVVVSLDYRLAPESQYPAAVEDVLAVADWLAANAAELGGDPALLAVGGDSAGGNLAAVTSQMRPGLFGLQVLIYPPVDMTFSFPSIDIYAEGFLLTKAWMLWFRDHYLGGLDVDFKDPRISPLYASDSVLVTCPPAFVLTTGYDPLQDEGLAYADKLEGNGVAVHREPRKGSIRGWHRNNIWLTGSGSTIGGWAGLNSAPMAGRDVTGTSKCRRHSRPPSDPAASRRT